MNAWLVASSMRKCSETLTMCAAIAGVFLCRRSIEDSEDESVIYLPQEIIICEHFD